MKFRIVVFFLLSVLILCGQQVPRQMVILEIGTGTWCQFCPGAAMGADDLIASGANAAIIEYHDGDSFENNYSAYRVGTYYDIGGYPTTWVDGIIEHVGGSQTNSLFSIYNTYVNIRNSVPSSFSIELAAQLSPTSADVNITVTKVADCTATDLVLHLVLTESEISFNWFNQNHVNFVARTMIPNQFGTALDFSQEDVNQFDFTIDFTPAWNMEHLELVAFVQDNGTKEVHQGTKQSIGELMLPVSPLYLDFGTVETGSSLTLPVTLTNYWEEVISGVIFPIPGFLITDFFLINPGEVQQIDLTFAPEEAITYDSFIIFLSDNQYFQTQLLNVTGVGIDNNSGEFDEIPENSLFLSNSPNPFNPATRIDYNLVQDLTEAALNIYNINGQLLRSYRIDPSETGPRNHLFWDGTDLQGKAQPSGIYLYELTGKNFNISRKMMLLK